MRHGGTGAADRHRAAAPEEGSLTAPIRFVGSFPRADTPLDPPRPEVAFIGRSNVGKSSLLNALVGTTVARTSGTPGKTTMLNVFALHRWPVPSATDQTLPSTGCYLLDLPGYGYARASKTDRAGFRRLLAGVLHRPHVVGVVWLLDIRHEPSRDDHAMHAALGATAVPVLAALTKADKLPRGQRGTRRTALERVLGLSEEQIIVTSAHTGDGIPELRAAIAACTERGPREEGDAAIA